MTLGFNAPVARELAERITVTGADGTRYPQARDSQRQDPVVNGVSFLGPFPEKARFTLTLPANFRDDAGRSLVNAELFPLTVQTDEYPPLAKFPARFGILERNAEATLPVTVRNLEAQLDLKLQKVFGQEPSGLGDKLKRSWQSLLGKGEDRVTGSAMRIARGEEGEIIAWLRRVFAHEYPEGKSSLFADIQGGTPQKFTLPKPGLERAFEVMGIPLKEPGFYVVELASPKLGAALHGKPGPYYAQTAAFVTNLSVHLKLGRESPLVWVTALDTARPVRDAAVEVRDCAGQLHWQGKTDAHGVARIVQVLPAVHTLPGCFGDGDHQYFVTARTDDDFSLVLSD